jgi:hypothetical protein
MSFMKLIKSDTKSAERQMSEKELQLIKGVDADKVDY